MMTEMLLISFFGGGVLAVILFQAKLGLIERELARTDGVVVELEKRIDMISARLDSIIAKR